MLTANERRLNQLYTRYLLQVTTIDAAGLTTVKTFGPYTAAQVQTESARIVADIDPGAQLTRIEIKPAQQLF